MSTRSATLIFNPKTGRYNSRRRQLRPIQDVAARLESLGVKVDLQLTSSPGEATEIAARAAGRNPYASRGRDPYVTGSLGGKKEASHRHKSDEDDAQDD